MGEFPKAEFSTAVAYRQRTALPTPSAHSPATATRHPPPRLQTIACHLTPNRNCTDTQLSPPGRRPLQATRHSLVRRERAAAWQAAEPVTACLQIIRRSDMGQLGREIDPACLVNTREKVLGRDPLPYFGK